MRCNCSLLACVLLACSAAYAQRGPVRIVTVEGDQLLTVGGASVQLHARLVYLGGAIQRSGFRLVPSPAKWSSSDQSVATVDANGVVAPVAPGSIKVTSRVGPFQGTTNIIVTSATLTSICVSPGSVTLPKGLTQQFTAKGGFGGGACSQNITSFVAWSSSDTTVATITHGGQATAVAALGTATITATYGAVKGTATLTDAAPVLTSVTVSPLSITIALGLTQQFTATAHYSDGSTLDITATAMWSSSNGAVATINGSGLASSAGQGSTTIQAKETSTGTIGSASLIVGPPQLLSIDVTPKNQTIAPGGTLQFVATGAYTNGNQIITASVTWTSSLIAVATIDNTGLAHGAGIGSATITASLAGVSGSTSLTVSLGPVIPAGHYALLISGYDISGQLILMAGSVATDSAGNVTGMLDVNRPTGVVSTALAVTGSDALGADNRGTLSLAASSGTLVLQFALNVTGDVGRLIVGTDTIGAIASGTGVMRRQNPAAFALATFNGDFAFLLPGTFNGARAAAIGRFASSASGTISNTSMDAAGGGSNFGPLSFSGSLGAVGGGGRGILAVSVTGLPAGVNPNWNFAYYIINANEAFAVQIDSVSSATPVPTIAGNIVRQSPPFSAASANGTSVFSVNGQDLDLGGNNVTVGLAVTDGKGNVNGTLDGNEGGGLNSDVPYTGTYSIASNGRGTVTFILNSVNSKPFTLYAIGTDHAFLLEGTPAVPGKDVQTGLLEPQSGGPFTGASLSGAYAAGSQRPATNLQNMASLAAFVSGVFTLSSGTTVAATVDASGTGLPNPIAITGSFSVSSNGRGAMTLTSGAVATQTVIYVVSPGNFYMVSPMTAGDHASTVVVFQQ